MSIATAPHLNDTEWAAVAVALKDAHDCGCAPEPAPGKAGLLHRFRTFLFGPSNRPGLADPRIEAIRRFVCASYVGRKPATEFAAPLEEHGFNRAQIAALGVLAQ